MISIIYSKNIFVVIIWNSFLHLSQLYIVFPTLVGYISYLYLAPYEDINQIEQNSNLC